jgi:hypothetical protein
LGDVSEILSPTTARLTQLNAFGIGDNLLTIGKY